MPEIALDRCLVELPISNQVAGAAPDVVMDGGSYLDAYSLSSANCISRQSQYAFTLSLNVGTGYWCSLIDDEQRCSLPSLLSLYTWSMCRETHSCWLYRHCVVQPQSVTLGPHSKYDCQSECLAYRGWIRVNESLRQVIGLDLISMVKRNSFCLYMFSF